MFERLDPNATTLTALRDLGVSALAAQDLLADDLVQFFAGQLVVAAKQQDPATGEHRLYVALGADAIASDERARDELWRYARQRYPQLRRAILRLSGDRTYSALPGRPYMRYVLGPPGAGPEPPDAADWTVRPCAVEDRPGVVDMLVEALVLGYRGDGDEKPMDPELHCGQLLHDALEYGAVFTVHDTDGVFSGHVTLIEDEDELTGERFVELVDQFVLPTCRGTGAGRRLTNAALAWAADRRLPLRGHISGDDEHGEHVLRRLLDSGWRRGDVYWAMPIPAASTVSAQ